MDAKGITPKMVNRRPNSQSPSCSHTRTRAHSHTHKQRQSISLLCSTLAAPSHRSQHSEGKSALLAQTQIDRPTFITDWVMFRCKKKKKDRTAFDADECRVSASTPQQRPASTDLSRDSTGPDVARLAPQITFPIHLWKLPCSTEVAFGLLAPARKDAFADLKYHPGWQTIRAPPRTERWKSGRVKKTNKREKKWE